MTMVGIPKQNVNVACDLFLAYLGFMMSKCDQHDEEDCVPTAPIMLPYHS